MPNGGSDCCGSCWFNTKNKGEVGFSHTNDPGPDFCVIRSLVIESSPFYTCCANHPRRNPDKTETPLGPVYTGKSTGEREVWKHSPDTEDIRLVLLQLLAAIVERPNIEYPIGVYRDDVVVWQLGEFGETRAVDDLQRIAAFVPHTESGGALVRTRCSTVDLAIEALQKIQ